MFTFSQVTWLEEESKTLKGGAGIIHAGNQQLEFSIARSTFRGMLSFGICVSGENEKIWSASCELREASFRNCGWVVL